MTSLQLLTILEVWWKKRSYVSAKSWSKTLLTFLTMHAGLGNRTDKYKKYADYIEHGRIVTCPLCNIGTNNEIHILVECKDLKQFRITTTKNVPKYGTQPRKSRLYGERLHPTRPAYRIFLPVVGFSRKSTRNRELR